MEETVPNPCKRLKYEFDDTIQFDIIVKLYEMGLDHIVEQIFINLDYLSLTMVECVSKSWNFIISTSRIWEKFVKTKVVTSHPLFKRIFNLLKVDQIVSPEKCLKFTFRQIPEAINICCQKLLGNWLIPHNVFARVMECEFSDCDDLLAPPTHWQVDDNYIAIKTEEGLLRLWSRKTYKLEHEFQTPYGNNNGTCKNSYVIGDKLVLFLRPDGVIQVWDLMVNHITFDISDLKGAKIVSLYFNPEDGVLVSSSNIVAADQSQCGSLITVWKQCKNRRGHFFLKYQQKLLGIKVLQILGWNSGTFGLLCTNPRNRELDMVQIYTCRDPFKLKCEIELESNYKLDWADGYLVIAYRRTLKLYDSTTGVCLRMIEETPMSFSDHFCHVSVCSTTIAVCYTLNEDEDDERTDLHVFYMANLLDPNWIPHVCPSYLLSVPFPIEKLKMNELQIVGSMLDVDSVLFQLVEFYPACANCGLYKLGMAETFSGSRMVLRCEDCLVEQYCSTLCLQKHYNFHKANDCDNSKTDDLIQFI